MTAPLVVKTLLAADATVAATVGTKIYPAEAPEEPAPPYIVYWQVFSTIEPVLDAGAGFDLRTARVQTTVYADTYAGAKTLIAAIKAALKYQSGTIAGVVVVAIIEDSDGPDEYFADLRLHAQSVDWRVVFYD